ncbi:ribonuclease H-like domain-containing protein, partial [Tanacetum coccineum]
MTTRSLGSNCMCMAEMPTLGRRRDHEPPAAGHGWALMRNRRKTKRNEVGAIFCICMLLLDFVMFLCAVGGVDGHTVFNLVHRSRLFDLFSVQGHGALLVMLRSPPFIFFCYCFRARSRRIKTLALPADSSSHMVLMADSSNTLRSSPTPQVKSWRPCFNFARGACRFGDLCRYVHDANARTGNNNNGSNTRGRGTVDASHTTNKLLTKLIQQLGSMGVNSTAPSPTNNPPVVTFHTGTAPVVHPNSSHTQSSSQPETMGSAPMGQATTLPHAFNTEMLQDLSSGGWNMDTRGEVLRHLISSNFILCNKKKPPVLCHACQLGKHVRLLFVSSNTVISSCFDIIHSDVWTSPIPSLS